MEIWKDVVGYEGYYEVSNKGRVKSIERYVNHSTVGKKRMIKERIIRAHNNEGTYQRLMLAKEGHKEKFHVHRLVAIAFLPQPKGSNIVNHIDANPANNCVVNLEWTTQKGNAEHAVKMGLYNSAKGEKSGKNILMEEDVLRIRDLAQTISCVEISREYGVHAKTINLIVRGINWKHIGGPRTFKSRKK